MSSSKRLLVSAAILVATGLHTSVRAQEITYIGYSYLGTAFGCAFAPKPFNGKGSTWYPWSYSASYLDRDGKVKAAGMQYVEFSNDKWRRFRWQVYSFPAQTNVTVEWVWRSDKNQIVRNRGTFSLPANFAQLGFVEPAGCWEGSNPVPKAPLAGQPKLPGAAGPASSAPTVASQPHLAPAPSPSVRTLPAPPTSGGVSQPPGARGPSRL